MPFHVEVRSAHNHARVFNIGDAELQQILKLWIAGQIFEFGEREWEPRESKLTVLEGKLLESPDLAFGQGWSNALRSAKDVTQQVVASEEIRAPLVPVVAIEGNSIEAAMVSGNTPAPLDWSEARARIDGRDPTVAAVILVLRPSEPEPSQS